MTRRKTNKKRGLRKTVRRNTKSRKKSYIKRGGMAKLLSLFGYRTLTKEQKDSQKIRKQLKEDELKRQKDERVAEGRAKAIKYFNKNEADLKALGHDEKQEIPESDIIFERVKLRGENYIVATNNRDEAVFSKDF